MGSINQLNKFIPNLATLSLSFRKFLKKKKAFSPKEHQEAFEKNNWKNSKRAMNHLFNVTKETSFKCNASTTATTALGISVEQNHKECGKL